MSNMIRIKGKSLFTEVLVPDQKYNMYQTNIYLDPDDARELEEKFTKLRDQKRKEVLAEQRNDAKREKMAESMIVAPVSSDHEDADGNPTGNRMFKAKMKPQITYRDGTVKTQRPRVVDANLVPITDKNLKIGNGSDIVIVVEPYPYYMAGTKTVGVSLRLHDFQLVKLNEGKQDLLEAVDGGYTSSSVEAAVEKDDQAEEASSFEDDIPEQSEASDAKDEWDV